MKPSKDEFAKMLDNTTDVAKQLQLVFPDPRDAIMSLSLILVGLSKSIGMPKDTVVQLVEAVYKDMKEDTSDEEHSVH
jgi:hypothetical protein